MKKRGYLGIISIFTSFMIGVCGCTMTKYELNERQKSILAEGGLPTEYEELRPSQQRAIVAIEEMLQYAEDKYGIPFSYKGYVTPSIFSPLDVEHTNAYPTSGDKERDWFTIEKTEEGYKDNYVERASTEGFISYVRNELKRIYPNVEVKVFGNITSTTLTEVPTDDTQYDGNVGAALCIFIDDGSEVEENASLYQDKFDAFMNEHKLYGSGQIICMYEGGIGVLNEYNYTDYLSDEYYWSRETLYFRR